MRKFLGLVIAVLLCLSAAPAAIAGEVLISGSGTWGSGTPTTAYSAPGDSWSFSFDMTNPFNNGVTNGTDFKFYLDGNLVTTELNGVIFYPTSQSGMFDLSLPGEIFSLYGADIGSSGSLSLGAYGATSSLDDGLSMGSGVVILSTTGVPEPSSFAVLATVMGLVGFALWRRRSSKSQQS